MTKHEYYCNTEEGRGFCPVFPVQLSNEEFEAEYDLNCNMPYPHNPNEIAPDGFYDDLVAMENALITLGISA